MHVDICWYWKILRYLDERVCGRYSELWNVNHRQVRQHAIKISGGCHQHADQLRRAFRWSQAGRNGEPDKSWEFSRYLASRAKGMTCKLSQVQQIELQASKVCVGDRQVCAVLAKIREYCCSRKWGSYMLIQVALGRTGDESEGNMNTIRWCAGRLCILKSDSSSKPC